MDADELHDLMLLVRSLYRGGDKVTRPQALLLRDVSRSLDDLAIDAGRQEQVGGDGRLTVGQPAWCRSVRPGTSARVQDLDRHALTFTMGSSARQQRVDDPMSDGRVWGSSLTGPP